MLSPDSHPVFVCYVSGSRFVRTPQTPEGHSFEVLDFNPTRVRHALQNSATSNEAQHWEVITAPSILLKEDFRVFLEDVETSMPYVLSRTDWTLPPGTEAVMIDEDNIIVVNDGEEQYEILTF